jgi:HK97 family phage major capsid protein
MVEAPAPGKTPAGARLTLGETFVKSATFEAFRKAYPVLSPDTPFSLQPVKVGTLADWHANRKAAGDLIVVGDAHVQDVRMPTVDLTVKPRPTLLDLISRGSAAGDFEYLQITATYPAAAIVPEATSITDNNALKPLSDLSTQLAYARAFTYADGFPVTNQLLSDAPALATFMNTELKYNLDRLLEDKLLNGDGSAGQPTGLDHTTGTQVQGYTGSDAIDLVKAIRQAITKVTTVGGQVTGIVMSPEDDEAIDLMQDLSDRFYGQGPFGTGPQTLWGRPRIVSDKMTQGTVWVGEWSQIALLDREGLSIMAFNQHSDWARRNLTYVRAELRAQQVIWRPARFCKVGVGLS